MTTGLRKHFLGQASVSLQDSAPSLAQQLTIDLEHIQGLSGNTRQATQPATCPACGSTRIQSRTATNTVKARDNSKTSSVSLKSSDLVIFKCQSCLRSTKLPAQALKEELSQESVARPISVSANEPGSVEGSDTKIQKTSSKKRAKERKNRAGLQSLLGRRNENPELSKKLDLMDFMSSLN